MRSDYLEDKGVDGRILLEWIIKKACEDVDWTHLNQDRIQWRVLVNILN
jgi:hypothetical protein